MNNDILFKDIDLSFEKNLYNDISVVTNISAIKRSVTNLILTHFSEKLFQPDVGSGLKGLLFEHDLLMLNVTIYDEVQSCLNNFEPRVNFVNAEVDDNGNIDDNSIKINIEFSIFDKQEIYQTDIILSKIR